MKHAKFGQLKQILEEFPYDLMKVELRLSVLSHHASFKAVGKMLKMTRRWKVDKADRDGVHVLWICWYLSEYTVWVPSCIFGDMSMSNPNTKKKGMKHLQSSKESKTPCTHLSRDILWCKHQRTERCAPARQLSCYLFLQVSKGIWDRIWEVLMKKEMLSNVHACIEYHYYIFGKQVTIYNDHKTLENIYISPF